MPKNKAKLVLTDNDIKFLIARPYNGQTVAEMQKHDRLLRIFSTGENDDLLWADFAQLFDKDLWVVIQKHFKVHSTELLAPDSGSIFTHFAKIHQTQEGSKNDYNFGDLLEYNDWLGYNRSCYLPRDPNSLPFIGKSNESFYSKNAIHNALYSPNSRLLIDEPNVTTQTPSPYLTIIPVNSIHDLKEDEHGTIYLISKVEQRENPYDRNSKKITKYYVYDTQNISVWEQKDNGEPIKIFEKQHELGICPIIASSSLLRFSGQYEFKKSPITDAFYDLYDYNLLKNCVKYHVWQKGVPPSIGIKSDCKGWNDGEGRHWRCEAGVISLNQFINDLGLEDGNGLESGAKQKIYRQPCPNCQRSKSNKFNFGKQVEINYQDLFGGDGVEGDPQIIELVRQSLGFVETDTTFLTVSEQILQNKKIAILETIIGETYNKTDSKEAFTVEQIKVSSDGKIQTLQNFAEQIEGIQTWSDGLLCKIRYETFNGLQIYFGRGYFFENEKEVLETIAFLNTVGSDISLKSLKMFQVAAKNFAQNKDGYEYHNFLLAIIPFSDLSTEQFLANYDRLWNQGRQGKLNCLVRQHALEWSVEFELNEKNHLFFLDFLQDTKYRRIKKWFYDKAESLLLEIESETTPAQIMPIADNLGEANIDNEPLGVGSELNQL